MRECTLTTESRVEECGIVAQVVKCAPRVCGDDPFRDAMEKGEITVLPAYAGMIPLWRASKRNTAQCYPRMRG